MAQHHPAGGGAAVALAVDIGGTKVAAALVDDRGEVLPGSVARRETGAMRDAPDLGRNIADAVRGALEALPEGARVVGVGIGSAGPVDLQNGAVSPKNLPNLAQFRIIDHVSSVLEGRWLSEPPHGELPHSGPPHGEPLRSVLPDGLRAALQVTLRLDGTCIALAEHWRGATRGARNSMALVVSTGVGGGIILDDAIVSGATGNAGHIGQMHLRSRDPDGPPDSGTLEGIASGPCTVAWARRRGWAGKSGEDLADSYARGDAVAVAAVRRSAAAVGRAIANVTTVLDLEAVAIGGGFSNVASDYVDLVREAVAEDALFAYAAAVRVEGTGLTSHGPLIGAAALVHRGRDVAVPLIA